MAFVEEVLKCSFPDGTKPRHRQCLETTSCEVSNCSLAQLWPPTRIRNECGFWRRGITEVRHSLKWNGVAPYLIGDHSPQKTVVRLSPWGKSANPINSPNPLARLNFPVPPVITYRSYAIEDARSVGRNSADRRYEIESGLERAVAVSPGLPEVAAAVSKWHC